MKRRREKYFAYKPSRNEYESGYPNLQTRKAIYIFYLGRAFAPNLVRPSIILQNLVSCFTFNSELL